ncbi:DUF3152 domain-containing protein, partial [Streptomyces sp. B1866]|uniref:DUF3152 domain-containing protein n=1 Tax=Streptomyces sp. B1866 TaxID=3075431 RepID=UPI00288D0723
PPAAAGGAGPVRHPRPLYGLRTADAPWGPVATGRVPGPREEYLAAFDVFQAAAPEAVDAGTAAPEAAAPGRVPGYGTDPEAADPAAVGRAAVRAVPGAPPPAVADARTAGWGRGRMLTGVAAAAVTTALAVVVAGQVADSSQNSPVPMGRGDGDTGRGGGVPRPDGLALGPPEFHEADGAEVSASYEQKMARTYPLDPKLKGPGSFTTVGGHDRAPGRGTVLRYRVDVERGLPLDGALFAQAVHKTLNDDRSWGHGGTRTFERVSSGRADFVVTLASPGTTATWCAKSGLDTTQDNVSCDSASTERVVINAYRWAQGAETFGDRRLHAYRQMLINHEVGHRLGHGHEPCTRQGAPAPVMMQQTKFLTTDGVTCRPNAWPYPKP